MQAVILSAGKGTRMMPLTQDTPKPMLKIGNLNLIEYKIDNLPDIIDEIVFVIGYKGQVIKDYFKDQYHNPRNNKIYNIKYIEHIELDGTGGAIRNCKEVLKDNFLILMGDDLYTKKDLSQLIQHNNSALLIDLPQAGGGKAIVDNKSYIVGLQEGLIQKAISEDQKLYTITGAYFINKDNFFEVKMVKVKENEYGLPHTIFQDDFVNKYPIKAVFASKWRQITDPETLHILNQEYLNNITII